ncbi:helix-turn-helix transcriptional regulator [Subtercola vilae]|uniref:WYL domain-containing transcriptional regulator n=1 Tax=Subtercola vilae TaxID=2056433 RepID=A0A4T2C4N1_9MICO|nr:WYL domain-containing protein [Subtercola vilae]TIH37436.1 WYL domain-containing transcriptional regulator [Subtercola vilae]
MISTTSRLLLVLSLLQTGRDWPGQLLADRLEVSQRTVRRDVDRLREMGYRVRATKGPGAGYRLEAGSELPPLLFDDEQAVALAVGLQSAIVAGAGMGEAAVRALATVRQVMPSRLRHRLDALRFTAVPERSTGVAAGTAATPAAGRSAGGGGGRETVSPDVLVALSLAIRAREVLRFDYAEASGSLYEPGSESASGSASGSASASGSGSEPGSASVPEPSEQPVPRGPRRVEPHHLVTSRARWYLVAWDLEKADWRIFRVDRFEPRSAPGPRFSRRELPGGASVQAFVAARFAGSEQGGGWPCVATVILNLPAREVLPFAEGEAVEDLGPHRCSLVAGSWSWVALAASLGRFDTDIEVVGPPELAAAFGVLAARYAATAAAATTERSRSVPAVIAP